MRWGLWMGLAVAAAVAASCDFDTAEQEYNDAYCASFCSPPQADASCGLCPADAGAGGGAGGGAAGGAGGGTAGGAGGGTAGGAGGGTAGGAGGGTGGGTDGGSDGGSDGGADGGTDGGTDGGFASVTVQKDNVPTNSPEYVGAGACTSWSLVPGAGAAPTVTLASSESWVSFRGDGTCITPISLSLLVPGTVPFWVNAEQYGVSMITATSPGAVSPGSFALVSQAMVRLDLPTSFSTNSCFPVNLQAVSQAGANVVGATRTVTVATNGTAPAFFATDPACNTLAASASIVIANGVGSIYVRGPASVNFGVAVSDPGSPVVFNQTSKNVTCNATVCTAN